MNQEEFKKEILRIQENTVEVIEEDGISYYIDEDGILLLRAEDKGDEIVFELEEQNISFSLEKVEDNS